MQSANTIMKIIPKLTFIVLLAVPIFGLAQINSPYSRYGVGNIAPASNIANRAMGGISAGVSDPTWLNPVNPASYANLRFSTLDLGLQYTSLNLKSKDPIGQFKSKNALFNYVTIGLPLLSGNKKAFKKQNSWTLAFGLRPITKISYNINSRSKINSDSVSYLYEGNGGMNEAFIGTALKLKNFSFGVNTGYIFGEKDYSSQISFLNDTVAYQKGDYETQTRFGGLFLTAGLQYQIKVKDGYFRMGAYSRFKNSFKATRSDLRQTFSYGVNGETNTIDTVQYFKDQKGTVQIPATFGFGVSLEKPHLMVGADFETAKWDDYRFFGQKDMVKNSWTAKAGIQYFPASPGVTGYFNYVKYRAGFSFGNDYITVDNKLPIYNISLGGAFPLKIKHAFYDNQYSVMNVTLEYESRGNKNNNLTENYLKVSLGFSLGDIWFVRQKYQ